MKRRVAKVTDLVTKCKTKMEDYNIFVIPLICILKIFGTWPAPTRLEKNNLICRIFVTLYTIFVSLLCVLNFYRFVHFGLLATHLSATKVVSIFRMACNVIVRFSILHLSIFAHRRVSCGYKCFKNKHSATNAQKVCILTVFLLLLSCFVYITWYALEFTLSIRVRKYKYYKEMALTKSDYEAFILFASEIADLVLYVTLTPTVLILAHSVIAYNQYLALEKEIKKYKGTKLIRDTGCSIMSSLKEKTFAVCDFVQVLDEAFRYYILSAVVDVGMNILNIVYFWQFPNCRDDRTFAAMCLYDALGLLILCVSGVLVSNGVCVSHRCVHNHALLFQ